MLSLQKLEEVKNKLKKCDTSTFSGDGSFKKFISHITIGNFRHINGLDIDFSHPVTVISGSNKIGKTSLLLLIACSHENFLKIDSTTTETTIKKHAWKDVLRFTKYESDTAEYSYKMTWRIGKKTITGEGKRVGAKRSWIGLAKKSKEKRQNAKIKDFEVRLIDLDRVGPARNFSRSLQTKVNKNISKHELSEDIAQAFAYIFDLCSVKIFQIGEHITKRCYLVESTDVPAYSSYGTASGEDAVLNILIDLFDSPNESLILIDELEAGFHPLIQRKLADIIQYVSWSHKKQFIITTHSPTLMSSFPQESRRFIENNGTGYRVISKISTMAAFSKMDIYSHPLLRLYCEDNVASFLTQKVIADISQTHPAFNKLINIIKSGPANQVKEDFSVHKRIFDKMLPKIGFCCVFDGDHKGKDGYNQFSSDEAFFLYPYEAPEKFLARAYLATHSHPKLSSFIVYRNHHKFFNEMCVHGIASDEEDARDLCFNEFGKTKQYQDLKQQLRDFMIRRVTFFSNLLD